MPTPPYGPVPVQVAAVSMLVSSEHGNRLYSIDNVAIVLNIAAGEFDGARVAMTMLLHAFASKTLEWLLRRGSKFGNGHYC